MTQVHYIFDPMCGWCYGATSLIQTLVNLPGIELHLHPGGMMERTTLDASFRQHILEADQRIAQMTGQEFGEGYIDRIRSGQPLILDSYLTTQAILAAGIAGKSQFEMLKRIQQAHYVDGQTVADPVLLAQLAQTAGLDSVAWQQAMDQAGETVIATIEQTRSLMHQAGLGGFPSLLLEQDGELRSVPVSQYYGRPADWQALWQSIIE